MEVEPCQKRNQRKAIAYMHQRRHLRIDDESLEERQLLCCVRQFRVKAPSSGKYDTPLNLLETNRHFYTQ